MNQTEEGKQLATKEEKYTLDQWIQSDKFKRNVEGLLGTPIFAERFIQIALGAIKRNEKLRECWQPSFFDCLLKLNQINLEPDGYHAHIIPFWNNKAKDAASNTKPRLEAQLIIDYKGLVTVMRRNPEIAVVKGAVVYAQDGFRYHEGSNRVFEHQPTFKAPDKDNPILGAYSFVKFKDGDWEVDFLPTWKIEKAREASRAKDSGPWVTNYDEMAIKTAHRHHSKTLPLRPEERRAIAADDDQFEFEPFENRPQLPQKPPQFLTERTNESSVPKTDQSDSQSTRSTSKTNRIDDKGRTEKPRKQRAEAGEKFGEKGTPAGDRADGPAMETGERQADKGSVQSGGEPKEEKEYKYGPGDEESTGDVVQAITSDSGSTEERSEGKLSKKAQELIGLMTKHQVKFEEVITVLEAHDVDAGEAPQRGIAFLPDQACALCVKQWGTIMFNVRQAREAFKAQSAHNE